MKVGFIGLGNMGQGMAENLLSKGADLNVYTRNPEKIKIMEKKGAKGCYSLDQLVENSEIIFTCLPDINCLLYTSPSPRDVEECRMPSSA